jgi:hypothetical protein
MKTIGEEREDDDAEYAAECEKVAMDDLGFGSLSDEDEEGEEAELEEEEDDDDIKLSKSMLTEIDGVEYYKTKAYGFDNFLFSKEAEKVGVYEEETGMIREVMTDDSEDESGCSDDE